MYYASCRIKARTHHIPAHCPYCIIILGSLNCCFISITCILYITCYYTPFTTGYSSIYYISFGSHYRIPVYFHAGFYILEFSEFYICKCFYTCYTFCWIKARTHDLSAYSSYCIIILDSIYSSFINIICIILIICNYAPSSTRYSPIYNIIFSTFYFFPIYYYSIFCVLKFSQCYILKLLELLPLCI